MNIAIKLLHPSAKIPVRAKAGDAAYDLFAVSDYRLPPGQRTVIPTGIAVAIPVGYYGRIAGRSGLALKSGILIGGGVVDSSYRGEIGVIMINSDTNTENGWDFVIRAGDRVAQLIIERCYDVDWQIVDDLPTSDRAATGFGSSGT